MSEKQHLLAPLTDSREPARFTQSEAKTYECITNDELPEWQREFAKWTWYTQAPMSVWSQHVGLAGTVATKIVHGGRVNLEPDTIEAIKKVTAALTHLFNNGVLPCSDRKAFAGILKVGMDAIDWQNFYAWYQAQQQQTQQTTEGE
jgi:hypothetical protein|nr:MAG TPA_asm: hypothetical protein [Caudoviricetes sp.]